MSELKCLILMLCLFVFIDAMLDDFFTRGYRPDRESDSFSTAALIRND